MLSWYLWTGYSVKKYDVSRHELCVDFTKWNDIFKSVPVISGYMTVLVFQVFISSTWNQNHWDWCVWGMVRVVIRIVVDIIGMDLSLSVWIHVFSSF